MPDWLADPDRMLLWLLAAAAIASAAAWVRTRRRQWLALAAGAAAVLAVLLVCDRLFESDREQIARKLQTMAAAVEPRNLDAIFAEISDTFRYGTTDKKGFRQFCDAAMRSHSVHDLVVWDFRVQAYDESRRRAEVSFRFKMHGTGGGGFAQEGFYLCKAVFVRDADGQWRLQSFQVYPPTGFDPPLMVPGLG